MKSLDIEPKETQDWVNAVIEEFKKDVGDKCVKYVYWQTLVGDNGQYVGYEIRITLNSFYYYPVEAIMRLYNSLGAKDGFITFGTPNEIKLKVYHERLKEIRK